MASSFADDEPVRDIEFYKKIAQRDLELIEDMREEISALKISLNKSLQRSEKYKSQINRNTQAS